MQKIFLILLLSVLPLIIGLSLLYFVIKLAVKNALKEHERNKLK